jgi:hypothetical protein
VFSYALMFLLFFLCIKFSFSIWMFFSYGGMFLVFLVYFLRQGGDHDFQVIHLSNSGDKYAVNLQTMLCDCRKWNLTGLPCCHAIACMKHKHYNIDEYVPSIYKKEAYAECYSSIIYPANGENL